MKEVEDEAKHVEPDAPAKSPPGLFFFEQLTVTPMANMKAWAAAR